jgi:hypothetical protein
MGTNALMLPLRHKKSLPYADRDLIIANHQQQLAFFNLTKAQLNRR